MHAMVDWFRNPNSTEDWRWPPRQTAMSPLGREAPVATLPLLHAPTATLLHHVTGRGRDWRLPVAGLTFVQVECSGARMRNVAPNVVMRARSAWAWCVTVLRESRSRQAWQGRICRGVCRRPVAESPLKSCSHQFTDSVHHSREGGRQEWLGDRERNMSHRYSSAAPDSCQVALANGTGSKTI